jgi:hypothetical protein
MASKTIIRTRTSLLLILFVALFSGCTEKKSEKKLASLRPRRMPAQVLAPVSEVMFDGQEMVALQMTQKAGALYLTGRPFGFSRWDITANPEAPHMTFAASDNILGFVPNGKWIVDYFAGGALGILGPYAYMSGAVGMSAVDIGQTETPVERGRYPAQDPNSDDITKDAEGAYAYRAIAANPTVPVFYGFREQDYVYTLSANGPKVQIVNKEAYGQTNVCCVNGATVFKNKLFVAFTSSIWMFEMESNGRLSEPTIIDKLQAYDVQASDNYLYVHHQPTYASSSAALNPPGVYVFDETGEQKAFLPISPQRFAVSPSDSHLYANEENTSIRIYGMSWK